MTARYDAIVIGGSVGGLAAAAYLARAGHKVLLLEAEETLSGRAASLAPGVRSRFGESALYALDARIIADLGLRGLRFAVRDMPLVALREDGGHPVLARDARAAFRVIALQSPHDAQTHRRLRGQIFALARAMRPFWWEATDMPPRLEASQTLLLRRMATTSAASFLSSLDSDALKAALAFDAEDPLEPGSALALVWRAAQQMCGLQGAVATPQGGMAALTDALLAAAGNAGVEIRTRAPVDRLLLEGNSASGVALDTGEEIAGRAVLSSLSRHTTILGLAPTASAGLAETQSLMRSAPVEGGASILFLLNGPPEFGGAKTPQSARFVIADRSDVYASVATAAREGRLPDDLFLEITVPTASDASLAPPGQHLVSVRVRHLPLAPNGGWPALTGKLVERVVAALEHHAEHFRQRIVATDIHMPVEEEPNTGSRLMAPYAKRIEAPIEGLFFCGKSAEPMNAISGRAGRLAAGIANRFLAREKRA